MPDSCWTQFLSEEFCEFSLSFSFEVWNPKCAQIKILTEFLNEKKMRQLEF